MRRILRIGLAAALILVISPGAAAGGGWWNSIDLTKSHLFTDQRFEFREKQVLLSKSQQAEIDGTEPRFFPYLVAGVDEQMLYGNLPSEYSPDWWKLGDAIPMRAGTLDIKLHNSGFATVDARLDLSGIVPGTYHLMLCNDGCTRPLGDLLPLEVTVVQNPLVAQTANRAEDLRWNLLSLRYRFRAVARNYVRERDLSKLSSDFISASRNTQNSIGDLNGEISKIQERIFDLEKTSGDGTPASVWLLLGGLAGATLVAAMTQLRRRKEHRDVERNIEDELRDLQASEEDEKTPVGASRS